MNRRILLPIIFTLLPCSDLAISKQRAFAQTSVPTTSPTADVMRQMLRQAVGDGESVSRDRQAQFEQLISFGEGAASAISADVIADLSTPNRGGHSTRYLIQLAGGFHSSGAACVPLLTEMVKHGDTYSHAAAIALGQIGTPAAPAVPVLLDAVNNKNNPDVDYLFALHAIGSFEAVKAVEAAADRDVLAAKWIQAQAIGDDAIRSVTERIIAQLKSKKNEEVRNASALAVRIGLPIATAVVPLLSDETARYHAAKVLSAINLGWSPIAEEDEIDRFLPADGWRREQLLRRSSDVIKSLAAAESQLIEMVRSSQSGRQEAELLLGLSCTDDVAVDALIEQFKRATTPNDSSVQALSLCGKPALAKLLASYNAADRTNKVRGLSLAALVRIDPSAVPDLKTVLDPPTPFNAEIMAKILADAGQAGTAVIIAQGTTADRHRGGGRASGGQSLGSLPPGEASIVAIINAMKTSPPNTQDGMNLPAALDRVCRPQDVPVIVRELKLMKPDDPTTNAVSNSLALQLRNDFPTQQKLIADLSAPVRLAVINSIYGGKDHGPDVLKLVIDRWINDDSESVRKQSMQTLEGYGGIDGAKLIAAQIDTLPSARQADAVKIIAGQRGNITAGTADGAKSLLVSLLKAKSPGVRAAAIPELRPNEMNWPTSEVAALVNDPAPQVRIAVLHSLGGSRSNETAEKMLTDTDATVRGEAVESLLRTLQMPPMNPGERPLGPPLALAERINDSDSQVRGRLKNVPLIWPASDAAPFIKALDGKDIGPKLAALELFATPNQPNAPSAPKELQPSIERLMSDSDDLARNYAFRAAGSLPGDGQLLISLANTSATDADPEIRESAQASLQQITRRQRTSGGRPPSPERTPTSQPSSSATTTPTASNNSRTAAMRSSASQPSGPSITLPTDTANSDGYAIANAYLNHPDANKLIAMLESDDAKRVDAAMQILAYTSSIQSPAAEAFLTAIGVHGGRPAVLVALQWPFLMTPNAPPALAKPFVDAVTRAEKMNGASGILAIAASNQHDASTVHALLNLAMNDSSSAVRVVSLARLGDAARTPGVAMPELAPAILKLLSDPDPAVALAAARCGSSSNAFGDGGVREDVMHLRDACGALQIQLTHSDPTSRPALMKKSLAVAGDSPFFVPQWIQYLADPDPAVRASCVVGLRHYSGVWHAAREKH